jgi:hypothetical protein
MKLPKTLLRIVHKWQHSVPLSLIINRNEIMTLMAEALANHPFPVESVVRSRAVVGFNERVPHISV